MRLTALALTAALASVATAQLGIAIENKAATTKATYIQVKYDKSLVPQTGLTMEAWITYDETTLGTGWRWPTICRQNPNAGKESFWFRIQAANSNSRVLALGTTTSLGLRTVTYSFAAGEFKNWTHVAGTYDGKAMRLYVNGVLKATYTAVGTNLVDNGGVLNIGNGDGNVIENWNGELDEVRLWPYARTADEIKSTMNLALSGVPGQVSTWGLDFNANDSSNKNHGTNVGTVKYGTNALRLTGAKIGGDVYGAATAGCSGTPMAGVSGYAANGNKGFGITCLNASKGAGAAGFFFLGIAKLTSPINVNGANVWVNTGAGVLLGVVGDSNRLARIPAPLPTGIPIGTSVYGQFLFGEQGCTSKPAFTSEGLEIKIQK